MTIVETGARLHFGFQNLSLAHDRLYGGVGVGIDSPTIRLEAHPADEVRCDDDDAFAKYLPAIVELLDVPGAEVTVHERYGRHVGLGSGTQLSLAALVAVAEAYDQPVDPRAVAPNLGRGGRSGVGVATFESGGFVVDVGHPTTRFTSAPPERGDWTVPKPLGRWDLPDDWRFVLVRPETDAGPSGLAEEDRMRTVVEHADPGIADRVATLITRQLLPAGVLEDRAQFGRAVAQLGRLNGAWYADEQGGVYRPPAGRLVESLSNSPAIDGAGQSSWGPTVYGVTDATRTEAAVAAGEEALAETDCGGSVTVAAVNTEGARVVDQ